MWSDQWLWRPTILRRTSTPRSFKRCDRATIRSTPLRTATRPMMTVVGGYRRPSLISPNRSILTVLGAASVALRGTR